jgi:hypothetical protein
MTGSGIGEQWAASKVLGEERLWRERTFLHQLSRNGALLWVENHDQLWQRLLSENLGFRASWPEQRRILRLLPANLVRRLLWQTSERWFEARWGAYRRLCRFALLHGLQPEQCLGGLERRLCLAASQLDELLWCRHDRERGPIEIAENFAPTDAGRGA